MPDLSIVICRPSRSSTFGSQPSSSRARVMSGRRCFGSSTGSGLKTISDLLPVSVDHSSANSRMVTSFGLPMLTGSWKSDSAAAR